MAATPAPRLSAGYAGIATRGVALTIDAAIVNVTVLIGGALLGLVASLAASLRPHWLVGATGATGWALAVIAYFSYFWVAGGQTPGMRLMRIRVLTRDDAPLRLPRAIWRTLALGLAIVPCFAGFAPVLVDARRRGLHDMLAGTVVVHVPPEVQPR